MPASSASCASCFGRLELALVGRQRQVEAVGEPLARRRCRTLDLGALAVAARQPAARERAVGDDAHPVALAGGQHVVLDRAGEDRVGRLLAAEPLAAARSRRRPLRLDDLRGGKRRVADVADLALMDEVGQRAERLVDVGARDPGGGSGRGRSSRSASRRSEFSTSRDDPAARGTALVGVIAHRHVHLAWRARRRRACRRPAPCRRSPRTHRRSRRRRCRRS